jgi:RNA polymerase sigma-70 factor (ECF subfamily)
MPCAGADGGASADRRFCRRFFPADEGPADFARDVARSLDALPARQRDVLQSIAVEGATIGETAARLGVSEGAVRVALHRGLATLAKRAEKP